MQCVCMCVCVLRKDRITIQEKEREQQKLKDQEHEAKRIANERRLQTLKVQLNCDKLLVKLLVDWMAMSLVILVIALPGPY